ncbi:MAG: hypothetical protein ABSF14_23505, partial [Terriglobia bacterium]
MCLISVVILSRYGIFAKAAFRADVTSAPSVSLFAALQAAEKRWFFAFRFSGELIAGRFGLIRRDLRGSFGSLEP